MVMAQGNTSISGPHQGGWVDTPSGESWFVHFQDKEMYGRIIHLNPLQWVDGWPVIGIDKNGDGCGEPVTRYKKPNVGKNYPIATPPDSDEFNTCELGKQWQWHANYRDVFGFPSTMGYYRLYSHTLSKEFVNFWEVPNLLLQKFPAGEFVATTKLEFSAKAEGQQVGLIVMGWNYSYLAITKHGYHFVLQQAVCIDAEHGNPETITPLANLAIDKVTDVPSPRCTKSKTIYLQVRVSKGGRCTFD